MNPARRATSVAASAIHRKSPESHRYSDRNRIDVPGQGHIGDRDDAAGQRQPEQGRAQNPYRRDEESPSEATPRKLPRLISLTATPIQASAVMSATQIVHGSGQRTTMPGNRSANTPPYGWLDKSSAASAFVAASALSP